MSITPAVSGRPLARPVQYIKGIGPRKSAVLAAHGVATVRDLLYYVPRRYLDRSTILTIGQLRSGTGSIDAGSRKDAGADVRRDCTVVGEVRSFRTMGVGRKARFVLVLADDTGSMQCVWFGGVQYWKKAFEIGEVLAVSGQPTFYGSVLQFVHPALDRLRGPSDAGDAETEDIDWSSTLNTGGFVPLYPSGQDLERVGLDSAGFRRIISSAIRSNIDFVSETLPPEVMQKHRLIALRLAIQKVHFPGSADDVATSRQRLKFEELFFFQLMLALKRRSRREEQGISFVVESKLARRLVDSLPFNLTHAQVRAVNQITADMKVPRPLNRLLQGDVGSGKTVVALLCMLIAVDNGYQGAFMAPTEILAEQHFRTLTTLLKDIPVTVRLLVGGQRSRLRRDVLEDVRTGTANIVLGTHALFEKDVEFSGLGFVVIDEQHRFGVMQRALMRKKGVNPDVLVMTATPIPRTLSLTLYGDLDVSVIDELPPGRRPVRTTVTAEHEKEKVYAFVREQIGEGRQAYFVYPLIEESEKLDLKAAIEHYERLRSDVFPDLRLGLIHGRLETAEKDEVMAAFKTGEIDILVATTVIEVGIDVANATVMVIENAERFGLAQLHQLRGRVGRGGSQSYCILVGNNWVVNRIRRGLPTRAGAGSADEEQLAAVPRLTTMVETPDGFRIAEKDLQLRGPGDFLGTRQSGIPEFRVADIVTDARLLEEAREDAFNIVEADPHLVHPRNRMLADVLRAGFGEAMSLLHVG